MSAYIVNKESIERIATLIEYGIGQDDRLDWARRELKEIGYDVDIDKGFQEFAQALYTMNYDAVNQRYDENSQVQIQKYEQRLRTGTIFQDLKTVKCFLYQCSEGNVTESPLYLFIRDIERSIMNTIIDRIPEYEKANWE